ncbi:ATP-binding protein [Embleya sp. NBC_00888]|uniref:ATP-binding protein n=1 Tax=Embleya sp. NBC_00888 TaxID=2975960 RepID=UPI003862F14A|nr:ATP-binding protein [Embleya sp. NBC_00888]
MRLATDSETCTIVRSGVTAWSYPRLPGSAAQARHDVAELLRLAARNRDLSFVLVQVVSELVTNVIQHADGTDSVRVELALSNGAIRLDVSDQHPGRPEELPLSDDDESGRGLWIVWHLTRELGGQVVVLDAKQGGGKTIRVTLPGA